VFDLDGTLLDTMTLAPTAYADTIHALGGPDVSPSDIVAAWHIGPTPAVLAHFLGRPASVEDIECFYRHFEAAGAAVRPFPGVVEMVDALGRAGYRLGIFTSATRRATTLMLSAAGLDGYFPTVICGDEITEPKPAPEGLWLACQYLGVSVAATTYVGDAEVDLQCAENAGTAAVYARWGATTAPVEDVPLVADRPGDFVELLFRQTLEGNTHTLELGSTRTHSNPAKGPE
jgi:HAD superfamily hydrolase (TIGR01549 family)